MVVFTLMWSSSSELYRAVALPIANRLEEQNCLVAAVNGGKVAFESCRELLPNK